jgi:3-oxoacyl-[acyl-carrier-protein] synthase-3
VIVCDGLRGNVFLKGSEELARLLRDALREEFTRNWLSKLRGLIALPVINRFPHALWIRGSTTARACWACAGIVVKSHGSADSFAFEVAISRAWDEARSGMLQRIEERCRAQRESGEGCLDVRQDSRHGSYLPRKVLTNSDLAQLVDTSDDWIVARTGIRQTPCCRRRSECQRYGVDCCASCFDAAGIGPTSWLAHRRHDDPDMIFPSTACILQSKLGAHGFPCFDVQAVCSGFVYALTIADFSCARVMPICPGGGAEVYSRILDWKDRGTCVLFGDGAGAVVLAASETPVFLGSCLHADGAYTRMLAVPGQVCGGEVRGTPFVTMEGGAVFKFAVRVLEEAVEEVLQRHKLEKSAIDWLIPHQANLRIIEATARKLGLTMDHVVVTVDRHANTSGRFHPLASMKPCAMAASVPGQHIVLKRSAAALPGAPRCCDGAEEPAYDDGVGIPRPGLPIGGHDGPV